MDIRCLILALLIAVALNSVTLGQDAPVALSYEKLVERLRKGDYEIDFRKLREAYTRTDDYFPYPMEDFDKVNKALDKGRYAKALKLIDKLLLGFRRAHLGRTVPSHNHERGVLLHSQRGCGTREADAGDLQRPAMRYHGSTRPVHRGRLHVVLRHRRHDGTHERRLGGGAV